MQTIDRKNCFVLGLDLGTNSLGWALVAPEEQRIVNAGVRIFSPGTTGDIDSGKDESNATQRRSARQNRRQLRRRRGRKKKLFLLLQQNGLFPPGESQDAQMRHFIIMALDNELKQKLKNIGRKKVDHLLPYLLRKKGLDEELSLFEFGRALYHLGQRRGFLSNRKQQKDSDTGKVLAEIDTLQDRIQESGHRTLGEYLASLDPEKTRIRERYTHRRMYVEEFDCIWKTQAKYYPEILTEELREQIHYALFFQRKLRNQKHLVGNCELEVGKKRIAKSHLLFQRFRYWQKINDLTGINEETGEVYNLTPDQKQQLAHYFENKGDLTFNKTARMLKLPAVTKFNLAAIEKKLQGNKTAAGMRKIFGKRWDEFSYEQQDQAVADIQSYEKNDALKKRAKKYWNLDSEHADAFAAMTLENGYGNFSQKAIGKLLPLLEQGIPLQQAIAKLYPDRLKMPVQEFLPPVKDVYSELNNPVVIRSLSQLRCVVNQLIKKYGKPATIRIELARSLKAGKKTRQERTKRNKQNRKKRKEARAAIILEKELGFGENPPNWAIEKYLLAQECNWICPYTGKEIGGLVSLLGPESPFQVEHIIPRSRSMDNTYLNKTLCHHEFNIHIKKNKTPWELFHGDPDTYDQVLQRVRRFTGDARSAKLRRFTMKPEEVEEQYDQFCERQLRDTAYASRLSADYVACLYGGRSDGQGRLRVQVSAGQLTSILRAAWELNRILGAPYKSRDNHRHHAIDAIVTACAHPGFVQKIGKAFQSDSRGRLDLAAIEKPWPGFYENARQQVLALFISHAVRAPVNGQIHKETNYGRLRSILVNGRKKEVTFYRKPVIGLNKGEVSRIVDNRIRRVVEEKINEVGSAEKISKDDLPRLSPQGPVIKKVRIWNTIPLQSIGKDFRKRQVELGENHHIEIFEVLDNKGKVKKWSGKVVSLHEAMQRKRQNLPIVNRNHGANTRFLFSFVKGDCLKCTFGQRERIFIIRAFSTESSGVTRIRFTDASDARKMKDIPSENNKRVTINKLKGMKCQKIIINPLGELYRSNA